MSRLFSVFLLLFICSCSLVPMFVEIVHDIKEVTEDLEDVAETLEDFDKRHDEKKHTHEKL